MREELYSVRNKCYLEQFFVGRFGKGKVFLHSEVNIFEEELCVLHSKLSTLKKKYAVSLQTGVQHQSSKKQSSLIQVFALPIFFTFQVQPYLQYVEFNI